MKSQTSSLDIKDRNHSNPLFFSRLPYTLELGNLTMISILECIIRIYFAKSMKKNTKKMISHRRHTIFPIDTIITAKTTS